MKFCFMNPDQISLVAENEADRKALTHYVENRATAGFLVWTWQDSLDPLAQKFLEPPAADATIARVNFLSIEEHK